MSLQRRVQKKIKIREERREHRIKNRQLSRGLKLRIAVFRSLKHIYAQIIDDEAGKTVMSFSSLQLKKISGDKKAVAKKVGAELGKLAVDKDIQNVFFDRGAYLYHGRVKALADGLRESGLKF